MMNMRSSQVARTRVREGSADAWARPQRNNSLFFLARGFSERQDSKKRSTKDNTLTRPPPGPPPRRGPRRQRGREPRVQESDGRARREREAALPQKGGQPRPRI